MEQERQGAADERSIRVLKVSNAQSYSADKPKLVSVNRNRPV